MLARYSGLKFFALALAVYPHFAFAGTCAVPGTHSSIQAAVDDLACSDIELASQDYFELLVIDRSLALAGPVGGTAAILGQVSVSGGSTLAMLSDFRVEGGCPDGVLRVTGGGQATAARMQVVVDPGSECAADLLQRDGFED